MGFKKRGNIATSYSITGKNLWLEKFLNQRDIRVDSLVG